MTHNHLPKWTAQWRSKWNSFCTAFAAWLYGAPPQTATCSYRISPDFDCYVFLTVGEHNFIWLYKLELSEQTRRMVGFQAADPNSELTWKHAEMVTQKMRDLEIAARAMEVAPRQDAA